MKNNISKNMAFILVAWLFAPHSYATEKVDLKPRFVPNEKHSVQVTEENEISQAAMGQQQVIQHTKSTGLEFAVQEVQANGDAYIKVTYLILKEKTTSPMGSMEYDSTRPEAAVSNPLASTYEALLGESFSIKVNSSGKILKLNGIDEMFLRMAEKIVAREDASMTGKQKASMNKMYGSRKKRIDTIKQNIEKMPFVSEESVKNMLNNIVMMLPGRPVEVGDSWADRMSVWQNIDVNTTYTLKGSKNGMAIIDVNWRKGEDEAPMVVQQGPEKVKIKIVGLGQGTVEINKKNGWLINGKVNSRFSVSGKAGNQNMPSVKMDQTITINPLTIKDK